MHLSPRFFSMGPFRDEASVKIVVEDVDEPPVFERASYVMEVKEDAARGAVIGSVSASDPDDKSSLVRYDAPLPPLKGNFTYLKSYVCMSHFCTVPKKSMNK